MTNQPKTLAYFLRNYVSTRAAKKNNLFYADTLLQTSFHCTFEAVLVNDCLPSFEFTENFLRDLKGDMSEEVSDDFTHTLSKAAGRVQIRSVKLPTKNRRHEFRIPDSEFLGFWAAVTLIAMEGRDVVMAEEIRESVQAMKELCGDGAYNKAQVVDLLFTDPTFTRKYKKEFVNLMRETKLLGSFYKPCPAVKALMDQFREEVKAAKSRSGGSGTSWRERTEPQAPFDGRVL